MHPNPNKALSFIFSLIPGAGHMYLGLTRRGLSFMLLFAANICAVSVFQFFDYIAVTAALLLPVLWFLAFFDYWRFPRLSPEERANLKDDFLTLPVIMGTKIDQPRLSRKVRGWMGAGLILLGFYALYNFSMRSVFSRALEGHPYWSDFLNNLPHLSMAALLIVIGIMLILSKRRQLRETLAQTAQKEVWQHEE
ncbi:MAG: hypothetical protein LBQ33_03160 [Oscillospiraceae bacterium]|jgi:hypothetical protein|nr:hypothetical protein [Oscillospiraceae bacterium]